MRPFLDLSNLDYNGDTLIYYSRSNILFSIIFLISMVIASLYVLTFENGFIFSIVLWIPILIFGQKIYYDLEKINEVQFKINSKGIQHRNENFITWDNIENAKVISEESGDNFIYFFRYYISTENREIRTQIALLNISSIDLELALRIFTEKFNYEKSKS